MFKYFEELMGQKGVKMKDVADATGISPSSLSDWKSGRYVPKADKLQRIADYFGVSIAYLMNGKESEGYYLNEETARIAQEVFDNPDLRILFDAAQDSKPTDIRMAADMLMRFKEGNKNG